MRRIGQLLAWLGVGLGGLLSVGLALPWHIVGIRWIIAVGLAKLTYVAALGLIAGGAVLQRIARGPDARPQLPPPPPPD